MASPFLIFFVGIGAVVAALAIGFGGGLFLSDPLKDSPRKDKPEITANQDLPIATTPVTVRTPEENKAAADAKTAAKTEEPKHGELKPAEPEPAKPELSAATDGRAAPATGWVASPPPQTTGAATTSAPVLPLTTPLTPPPAVQPVTTQPAAAVQPAAPPASVTIRRGQDAEERVTVTREPRATDGRAMDRHIWMRAPKPTASRARREHRKSARPRAGSEDDDGETVVERLIDAPDVEPSPPAPPPMRDAGSLRGF